ncbi:hypothetical protein R3P38DRAFT_1877756 [Favolaschia claudopus]|uniref:Uncharacterized protein n=1 Tax=Favolaschia claudopus TaxID=2862362 RepID=A0AAW0DC92_9AGAR
MTTRRPPLTQRLRPSSQVYLGSDSAYSSYLSSPPDLPDLPEPPSPGSSSSTSTSGLPSPPATNSTGSGSTGDPGSIAFRGGTGGALNMLNGSNIKTFHAAFETADHSADHDDDYDDDNDDENGEDNTARLNHQRRQSASENVLALQRVKSLTQRNKIALDKLSSFSRHGSPAPSAGNSSARRSSINRSPPRPVFFRLRLRLALQLQLQFQFRLQLLPVQLPPLHPPRTHARTSPPIRLRHRTRRQLRPRPRDCRPPTDNADRPATAPRLCPREPRRNISPRRRTRRARARGRPGGTGCRICR